MKPNIAKTKLMLMTTTNTNKEKSQYQLQMQDETLQQTSVEKLLGVHIDDTLNFKMHIHHTLKKCNSFLYLLLRIKCFLDLNTRKLFFNAYILPHLDYCSSLWGNTTNETLDQLLKFQKRAARVILDMPFDAPSAELFIQLQWMTIEERVHYKKLIIMYNSLNKGPDYLTSKFKFISYQDKQLRSSSNNQLLIPKPNLEIYRKSITYSGSKLWNALPLHIRSAPTINQFKSSYIRHNHPEWAR